MLESADIMRPRGCWSGKPFGKVSTSPLHSKTLRRLFVGVKDGSSMLDKLTYRHRSFKPSPSPGHSWSRASTWSDPSKRPQAGFTHLLVAVDKFTKWIETKPITNIHSEEVVKFFLDIIYRFGVPNYII